MQGKDERHGKLSIQSENEGQSGAEGYRVKEPSVRKIYKKCIGPSGYNAKLNIALFSKISYYYTML